MEAATITRRSSDGGPCHRDGIFQHGANGAHARRDVLGVFDADLLAHRGDGLAHGRVRVDLELEQRLEEDAQQGWIFSQDELLQLLQMRRLGGGVGCEFGVVEELHSLVVSPALLRVVVLSVAAAAAADMSRA